MDDTLQSKTLAEGPEFVPVKGKEPAEGAQGGVRLSVVHGCRSVTGSVSLLTDSGLFGWTRTWHGVSQSAPATW